MKILQTVNVHLAAALHGVSENNRCPISTTCVADLRRPELVLLLIFNLLFKPVSMSTVDSFDCVPIVKA